MRSKIFGTLIRALILAACILSAVGAAAHPTFEFGFKGGLGMGKMRGEDTDAFAGFFELEGVSVEIEGDLDGYRMGFIGGVFFAVQFTDMFGARVEALYAMKGGEGEFKGVVDPGGLAIPFNADLAFKLNYFEIPILAVLNVPAGDRAAFNVMAGPSFSLKASAELAMDISMPGLSGEQTEDIDDYIKGADIGAVVGAGFSFDAGKARVFIDCRWTFGFSTVDDTSDDLDLKNSVISFMAGVGIPFGATE